MSIQLDAFLFFSYPHIYICAPLLFHLFIQEPLQISFHFLGLSGSAQRAGNQKRKLASNGSSGSRGLRAGGAKRGLSSSQCVWHIVLKINIFQFILLAIASSEVNKSPELKSWFQDPKEKTEKRNLNTLPWMENNTI